MRPAKADDRPEPVTGRPTGVTVVDEAHGSFLTCRVRLGCTDPAHARARADYQREARHRNGTARPAKRGRTHGTRSTYRICTAGPNGGKCEPCLEAERSYVADWRRRTGRITGAKRGPKPRAR
jgi:hypothetical protein